MDVKELLQYLKDNPHEAERMDQCFNCKKFGLEFDAVNANLPEMVAHWGNNPRKVFADVYIDDKAVNKPCYHVPYEEGL